MPLDSTERANPSWYESSQSLEKAISAGVPEEIDKSLSDKIKVWNTFLSKEEEEEKEGPIQQYK